MLVGMGGMLNSPSQFRVPCLFLILMAGVFLNFGQAAILYGMSHNCCRRISVAVSVLAAFVHATEEFPALITDQYAAG
jgi:hypothetical protein